MRALLAVGTIFLLLSLAPAPAAADHEQRPCQYWEYHDHAHLWLGFLNPIDPAFFGQCIWEDLTRIPPPLP